MRPVAFLCAALVCGLAAGASTASDRLLDAATKGELQNIKTALAQGADINARDKMGRTALLIALQGYASEYRVTGANEPIVHFLIERGASINLQDNDGWSPLLRLVGNWADQPDLLKFLLSHGADIKAKTKDGWSVLMLAARFAKDDRIAVLLDRGADIEARDTEGRTALMWAITEPREINAATAELLLKRGANIDAVDLKGQTAADRAAHAGLPDRVKLLLAHGAKTADREGLFAEARNQALLEAAARPNGPGARDLLAQGADPNVRDPEGRTALMVAIENNHNPDVIELMLAKGAQVNATDRDGSTALMIAGDRYKAATVKLLLDAGADVKARDKDGNTPLLRAAGSARSWDEKEEALIPSLLTKGAEADARNSAGVSPLMLTAREGNSALLELLERKVEVDARDSDGNTALLYAASRSVGDGQQHAVDALLQAGADPNAENRAGATPLMLAARQYQPDAPLALLAKGARIDARDKNGRTALMYAIDGPKDFDNTNHVVFSPKIVALLVDRHADVAARDSKGQTALKLAVARKFTEIVTLLRAHGATE
jgi:uncharacterized protein